MIKRRQLGSGIISEEDVRAILRQRALLAGRSALANSSSSCTVPPNLYTAWSDTSTASGSMIYGSTRQYNTAMGARVVNRQAALVKEAGARVFVFEKPFPKEETPYEPLIPETPRILKLQK